MDLEEIGALGLDCFEKYSMFVMSFLCSHGGFFLDGYNI
jgi:hypothetical protein